MTEKGQFSWLGSLFLYLLTGNNIILKIGGG